MKTNFRTTWLALASLLWLATCEAQMPNPPGQVAPGETPKHEAYLFAHMLHGDYWRLYYSVSLQGPWFQAAGSQQPNWDKYHVPPKVRHGSMLAITLKQYDTLVAAFGKGPSK